jgi:hypothetical protein
MRGVLHQQNTELKSQLIQLYLQVPVNYIPPKLMIRFEDAY